MKIRTLSLKVNELFAQNLVLTNLDFVRDLLNDFWQNYSSLSVFGENSLVKIYERLLRFYSENSLFTFAKDLGFSLLERFPKNFLANYYYANVLFSAKDYFGAAVFYLKTINLGKKNNQFQEQSLRRICLDSEYRYGICLFHLGKFAKAEKFFQKNRQYLDSENFLEQIFTEKSQKKEMTLTLAIDFRSNANEIISEELVILADEVFILASDIVSEEEEQKLINFVHDDYRKLLNEVSSDWLFVLKNGEKISPVDFQEITRIIKRDFSEVFFLDQEKRVARLFKKTSDKENSFFAESIRLEKSLTANNPFYPTRRYEQTISICMIVKDEEKFIAKALDSVSSLAAEIIVFDTGSADQTKEVVELWAKERKKNIQIFSENWVDDFSLIRNKSLEKASGEWILVLDADEFLTAESCEIIREEVNQDSVIAYSLNIDNQKAGELKRSKSFRLFRNIPEIYFRGRVQEQISFSLNNYLNLFNYQKQVSRAKLIHYSEEKELSREKMKRLRNIFLLEKMIKTDRLSPDEIIYSLNKLLYGYRAVNHDSFFIEKLISDALKIIYGSFRKINFFETPVLEFFCNACDFFLGKKENEKVLLTAISGMNIFPGSPYLLFFIANAFLNLQNYPSCWQTCENALLEISDGSHSELDFFSFEEIKIFFKKTKIDCQKKIFPDLAFTSDLKISACIIAKNEDDFIEKCIKSVIDIVDEVIVLDTGSDDLTVEKAKASGAKVYYYHWHDDFSAAKNKVLEFASGDWILSLDADEELEKIDRSTLYELCQNKLVAAYNVTRKEFLKEQTHLTTRLFRKHPDIFFEGAIHEQISGSLGRFTEKYQKKTLDSPLLLIHYGYLPEIIEKKKTHERNIKILRNSLNDSKYDPATIIYYKIKLAAELINKKDENEQNLLEAKMLFEEVFWSITKKKEIDNLALFPPIIQFAADYSAFLLSEGNLLLAQNVLDLALSAYPDDITLNYHRGKIYHQLQRYEKALEFFKYALRLYQQDEYNKISLTDFSLVRIYLPYLIGICYEACKSYQMATYWYKKSLTEDPDFLYLQESFEHSRKQPVENKISLCLIVKNEEQNLAECLKSVKNLVDEIIVVDTGSTDLSMSVAKKFGARVYQFPWKDNFSAARNYSIDLALYNWILVLDADEKLEVNKDDLKNLIKDEKIAGYYLLMKDYISETEVRDLQILRMFRNLPNISYEGFLHEKIKGFSALVKEQEQEILFTDKIRIVHNGYRKNGKNSRAKKIRNIETALWELENCSDFHQGIKIKLKLLFAYFENGELVNSEILFREIAIYIEKNQKEIVSYLPFSQFFVYYSDFFLIKQNEEQALYQILKGISLFPIPELFYRLACIYGMMGKYEKAINSYNKCLELGKNQYCESITLNKGIISYEALYSIGYCYYSLGKKEEAIEHFLKSLRIKPDYQKSLIAMKEINSGKK